MSHLLLIILLLCAILGAPLFIVIAGLALLLFASSGIDPQAVIIEMVRMTSSSTLVAIPLFTFAGYILSESKSPERLIRLYQSLFGWVPGGLAIVSLFACVFFTAITGASGVTIIALGGLLYPILTKQGYKEKFSLGLLTTGGSLGLLFPPSLPLLLYAIIANVNYKQLFIAGLIPGLLLITLLSAYSIFTKQRPQRIPHRFSWPDILSALRDAMWIIPLPVFIPVGIYGGFFTPSEAAALTVAYVLIIELFIYKSLRLNDLFRIASRSMILVGGILMILGCALGLTNYLVDEQIPMHILNSMKNVISNKYMFLAVLNIFLLIVGCLMDIFSAIIVVVPLIIPIAREFGVDPLHLGIIFLTNLEIGYSTPPVGLNLFISSFRFKKSIPELYKASLPFLGVLLFALMLITYLPDLSLFLVKWLNQ